MKVLVLSRDMAEQMYIVSGNRLVFTGGALLEDESGLRLETMEPENTVYCYPADGLGGEHTVQGPLGEYRFTAKKWQGAPIVQEQVGPSRYTLKLPENLMDSAKDVLLKMEYTGDIAHAFVNSRMISDNFYNTAPWEIGLRELAPELSESELVVAITPLKEGANVNVESPMAGRLEEVGKIVAGLHSAELCPVYEISLPSQG